jgi:hypothetical protein
MATRRLRLCLHYTNHRINIADNNVLLLLLVVVDQTHLDALSALCYNNVAREATLGLALDVDGLEAPDLPGDPAVDRAGLRVEEGDAVVKPRPGLRVATSEIGVVESENLAQLTEDVLGVDGAEQPVGVPVQQAVDVALLGRALEAARDVLVKVDDDRLLGIRPNSLPGIVGLLAWSQLDVLLLHSPSVSLAVYCLTSRVRPAALMPLRVNHPMPWRARAGSVESETNLFWRSDGASPLDLPRPSVR